VSDSPPDTDAPEPETTSPRSSGGANLDYTPTVLANLGVPVELYAETDAGVDPTTRVAERLRYDTNRLAVLEEALAGYRVERTSTMTTTHHVRGGDDPTVVTETEIAQGPAVETVVLYGESALGAMREQEPIRLARILVAVSLYGEVGRLVEARVGERIPAADVGLVIEAAVGAIQIANGVDPTVVSASLRGSYDTVVALRAEVNEALARIVEAAEAGRPTGDSSSSTS
jgi:hypothetical protein